MSKKDKRKKDPRPDNARWLTPYLVVADVKASMDFYQAAFGFDPTIALPAPDGALMHGEMSYHGKSVVMMMPMGTWGSTSHSPAAGGFESPVNLYVYCEDTDQLYAQALAAGAEGIRPPEAMFWGDRCCTVKDPDGYSWSFATQVGEFDPSKIPF